MVFTTRLDTIAELGGQANLVLCFGTVDCLTDSTALQTLKANFPNAQLVSCSTGTQISGSEIYDSGLTAIAIYLQHVTLQTTSYNFSNSEDSEAIGKALADQLSAESLRAVMVFTDGLNVNGTRLVKGLTSVLGDKVSLFGGLAGDGDAFQRTVVGLNQMPQSNVAVAVGFSGEALTIAHSAVGGWDTFGPKRKITSSKESVLYELDGKPALDLYEKYLGDEAEGLPASALLYPLCIWHETHPEPQVRTVLSIDRETRSLTFAGDIPQGWSAQLMRGVQERLVTGAANAAESVTRHFPTQDANSQSLALLISCVGRRMLMGSKTIEEVEAVTDLLGSNCQSVGLYSYGEIAPRSFGGRCDLHNQTMTVTLIGEDLAA